MAGKGVRVLVTPTSDLGKILACMHGECFFLSFITCLFSVFLFLKFRTCSIAMFRIIRSGVVASTHGCKH